LQIVIPFTSYGLACLEHSCAKARNLMTHITANSDESPMPAQILHPFLLILFKPDPSQIFHSEQTQRPSFTSYFLLSDQFDSVPDTLLAFPPRTVLASDSVSLSMPDLPMT
jgi:hypothetical protein